MVRNCVDSDFGTMASSETISVKCVATSAMGGVGDRARNLRNPASNPTPSAVAVPLPNSSTTHSDLPVQPLHICATLAQSAAKEPPAREPTESADEPTRVNTRSTRGTNADVAGTKEPTCARKTHAAIDLRYTLFPDWFGPVTTAMRPPDDAPVDNASVRSPSFEPFEPPLHPPHRKSFGTIAPASGARVASCSGCLAPTTFISVPSCKIGRRMFPDAAKTASDAVASISATHDATSLSNLELLSTLLRRSRKMEASRSCTSDRTSPTASLSSRVAAVK